jgi:hypothetical protein
MTGQDKTGYIEHDYFQKENTGMRNVMTFYKVKNAARTFNFLQKTPRHDIL